MKRRFIPRNKVTVGVTRATIKSAPFFSLALYDFAAVLGAAFWTGNTDFFLNGLNIMTLRKTGAAYEITESAVFFNKRFAAYRAHLTRQLRRRRRQSRGLLGLSDSFGKRFPELPNELDPVYTSSFNLVQGLFHGRSETDVDNRRR